MINNANSQSRNNSGAGGSGGPFGNLGGAGAHSTLWNTSLDPGGGNDGPNCNSGGGIIKVQVVRPAVAEIMDSSFRAILSPGDIGILFALPQCMVNAYKNNVPELARIDPESLPLSVRLDRSLEKFMLFGKDSGNEEYLEVAHTFFHYAYFQSGGGEMVCDLQVRSY